MKTVLHLSTAVVAAMIAILPIPASSHHSMSEYDRSVVTELEGQVTRVSTLQTQPASPRHT